MLDSGESMIKISDALKALPNCLSIALTKNWGSSKRDKMLGSLTGVLSEGSELNPEVGRMPFAVTCAVIHSCSLLREFNVMLDHAGSMPVSAFGPSSIRLAQLQRPFSNLATLKLQVRCWDGASDDFSKFVNFVNSFLSVTTLELSLHDPDIEPDATDDYIYPDLILRQIRLPKLRTLLLTLMVTDGLLLESFLRNHSASLRSVCMHNIGFTSAMEYIALFKGLVGKMQLQEFRLTSLGSYGEPNLDIQWLSTLGIQAEENNLDITLEHTEKSIARQILVGGH